MRVALVHDYLTQYGGAERVLEVLHNHFPGATVYTSIYDPDHLPDSFREWDIRTSPLQRIPGATVSHRLWTPFYPAIFGHVGFHDIRDADVVIAESSAWAHHAHPRCNIPVLCYCHSPARFLYGDPNYMDAARLPNVLRPLTNSVFSGLRWLDRRAARRLTHVAGNSDAVRQRIERDWGVPASVLHPPVDVERFRPSSPVEPEDWYLVVSRLVPHKWIDRAVRACTTANVPLKVIGSGRSERELRKIAGPTIEFLGERRDQTVVDHMQRCKALILPGIEDFGMTSVEAQAAGRPVFAARGGGALESVTEGVSGLFFGPTNEQELVDLLTTEHEWDTNAIQANATRFSVDVFLRKLDALVNEVLSEPR
ncbi:MAG TPA: glycosyltransferase [Thermomicrobiales bacterium]|nr:glycosyltransferase [Thermomicrobiales bacterium]